MGLRNLSSTDKTREMEKLLEIDVTLLREDKKRIKTRQFT